MKRYITTIILAAYTCIALLQAQDTMQSPVDLGSKGASFNYTDTKNTADYTNAYSGRSTNDVFYKFTLTQAMEVTISHCGSQVSDTYLHLLNTGGIRIAYNDDYSGVGKCPITAHSYLKQSLSPGTYYVVSEGYSQNGYITTTIEGIAPSIAAAASQDQNYIKTRTYTSDDGQKFLDAVQYFDGLGRPTQNVQVGITPSGRDLVTLQTYDGFGRKDKKWLPATNQGNGISVADPVSLIRQYYPTDTTPYSRPVYEASPLNRVLEQHAPGQDWQSKGKSVKTAYQTNVASGDAILVCGKYRCTSDMLFKDGNYDTGQLYVTQSSDEDGNTSYEFKDKLGQVVLTRQINNSEPYDTYYIYDDFGNLSAVLPPMLSDVYKNSSTVTTNTQYSPDIKNYAFLYIYDNRNRCIKKKLPGCDWVYYVYDKADQLILSQDGEQRIAKQWTFNIYDKFGRLAISGLHDEHPQENYGTLVDALKDVVIQEEAKASSDAWFWGYTANTLQNILKSDKEYKLEREFRLINYYDTYDVIMDRDHNNTYRFFAGGEGDIEGQPSGFTCQKYPSAKGLLVATIDVFSVDGANRGYVPTVMYYDSRGRMIQKRERPPLGLIVEFIDYNFTGQPTRRMIRTAYPQMTELYTYTYDHAGRLTKTTHKLNDAATVTLAENIYDELGRLQSTKANNQDNLKTAYTYNIRSWTKTITNPLFEQALFYNESSNGNTPAYNGNISVMKWVYKNPNTFINPNPSVYNFKYDPLSRLISANNFIEGDLKIRDNLSTNYEYDKHGNVLSLKRDNKAFLSNYIETDNPTLSYTGNQLKKVTDSKNASTGFIDYVNEDVEYTFNANGAMATDRNKGLNMTYDPYNSMPKKITVSNTITNGSNSYIYTATGKKLSVSYRWIQPLTISPLSGTSNMLSDTFSGLKATELVVTSQAIRIGTKSISYAGNKIYEDGNLQKILIDNGYIENGIYYFYVRDHLGNNRIVADAGGNVIQKTDYYPFGMPTSASTAVNAQPYKYNGKEYDMMNGLNQYDYHARQYDPATIRFTTMDPLAEKYHSISPYVYCANNPLKYIDPTGMDYWSTSDRDQIAAFLSFLQGNGGNSFNFGGWSHMTDVEFMQSDEYNTFTFNDVSKTAVKTVVYGDLSSITVIGKLYWPTPSKMVYMSFNNKLSMMDHPDGGRIEPLNIEFGVLFGGTHLGIRLLKAFFGAVTRAPGTTNTIDANQNGFSTFRGGKLAQRDASINRYPTDFKRWYHRYYKGNQRGDASIDELDDLYNEWINIGKPTVK